MDIGSIIVILFLFGSFLGAIFWMRRNSRDQADDRSVLRSKTATLQLLRALHVETNTARILSIDGD